MAQSAANTISQKDLFVGGCVDYFSSAKQSWLPVRITRVDSDSGEVEIDLRPGQWMGQGMLAKMRPHCRPGSARLEWVRAVMGSDLFTEEMSAFFQRHARPRSRGPGRPAIFWSEVSDLAAELDVQLGVCGSITLLEEEAKPKSRNGPGSEQEAFTSARFSCAFWKLLRRILRDYGHALPVKRVPRARDARGGADYEVQRELKRGTYGQVRLVRERQTGLHLAVKVISKAVMVGSEDLLEAEVGHLCRVDHPNIVRLRRHYEDTDNVYLVMDFCSGGDLQDRLSSAVGGPQLSAGFVVHVMRQLMRAVAHVHVRGIVHLDIKALNVMLTHTAGTMAPVAGCVPVSQGHEWPHVMLIDLGIAQLFRPGRSRSKFPGGTPATMAPEVWRGEVTPAADVFSCGVVFWELATLQLDPLRLSLHGDLEACIHQALQFWEQRGGPQWDWLRFGHLPDSAAQLGSSMLVPDRRQRCSAEACLDAEFLAQDMGGEPMEASLEAKTMHLIQMLRGLPRRSILHKSVALSIARKWPSNQLPTIQRAFHAVDASGTGSIGLRKLSEALHGLGLDAEEALEIAAVMDLNGDGRVDWTEFVAASVCLSDPVFEETLRRRFRKADADADGLLSRRELASLLPGCSPDDGIVGDLYSELRLHAGCSNGVNLCAFLSHFHAQGGDVAAPPTFSRDSGCPTRESMPAKTCPFENPNKRSAVLTL